MRAALSQLPLLEFLAAVLVFVLVLCMGLDRSVRIRDQSRADTLISNLDIIQIAIERYYTDFETYPLYLLGGDTAGWTDWHRQYDEPSPDPTKPQNAWVVDPLIANGYLESYPQNPFVSGPLSMRCDPRFGTRGEVMGNGVDDPVFFRDFWERTDLNLETSRTQIGLGRPLNRVKPWMMGGRRTVITIRDVPRFLTVQNHWPGAFVYRGFQTKRFSGKDDSIDIPGYFPLGGFAHRFLLGAFGTAGAPGQDIVRLESHDLAGQQLYYRTPPPWGFKSWHPPFPVGLRTESDLNRSYGLPEVAGGGGVWEGPFILSFRAQYSRGTFLYGSPDGEPDGLIAVRTTPGDGGLTP